MYMAAMSPRPFCQLHEEYTHLNTPHHLHGAPWKGGAVPRTHVSFCHMHTTKHHAVCQFTIIRGAYGMSPNPADDAQNRFVQLPRIYVLHNRLCGKPVAVFSRQAQEGLLQAPTSSQV